LDSKAPSYQFKFQVIDFRGEKYKKMAAREPMAFAKLATRNDVIPPFYITDDYVKARDESGYPVKIEVILGRFCDIIHLSSRQLCQTEIRCRLFNTGLLSLEDLLMNLMLIFTSVIE
jgi:hypothetical protein